MGLPLFDELEKLIVEHGSAAVMKERLALIRDQREALEKKLADLQQENAKLKRENGDLTRKLAALSTPDEFTKHRGVLFRWLPSGEVEDTVYCPRCKLPMFSMEDMLPFTCSVCKFMASFDGEKLYEVMSEIPRA